MNSIIPCVIINTFNSVANLPLSRKAAVKTELLAVIAGLLMKQCMDEQDIQLLIHCGSA